MAIFRPVTIITATLPVSLSMCFEDRALHLLHINILFINLRKSNLKCNNKLKLTQYLYFVLSAIMNIKQLCKSKSIWKHKPLMHVSRGVSFCYISYVLGLHTRTQNFCKSIVYVISKWSGNNSCINPLTPNNSCSEPFKLVNYL